jgi:hypothetical protein
MTIALNSVVIRHERRARLIFTAALASGAFTSTSFYTVTSVDGAATPPGVAKALAISDSPNVVELQMDADLVQGAAYSFSAVGVPAVDASVTPDPSAHEARMPREQGQVALGARRKGSDLEEVLYGRDLRWTGSDFAEAPGGDLDDTAGLEVVETDLTSRLLSDGLPWDNDFGLKGREYVDAPAPSLVELRGRAVTQLRQDDRVIAATVTIDLSDPAEPVLEATPTLVGGQLVLEAAALQLRQTI